MKSGDAGGLNVIYNEEGYPILNKDEKLLSESKGEFANPTGTLDPWTGRLYITNKRLIFIGREMFLPSGGILAAQVVQVANKIIRAKANEQNKVRLYAEIFHTELKKVKKGLLGRYILYLEILNKKYKVTVTPFKREFKQVMMQQYAAIKK